MSKMDSQTIIAIANDVASGRHPGAGYTPEMREMHAKITSEVAEAQKTNPHVKLHIHIPGDIEGLPGPGERTDYAPDQPRDERGRFGAGGGGGKTVKEPTRNPSAFGGPHVSSVPSSAHPATVNERPHTKLTTGVHGAPSNLAANVTAGVHGAPSSAAVAVTPGVHGPNPEKVGPDVRSSMVYPMGIGSVENQRRAAGDGGGWQRPRGSLNVAEFRNRLEKMQAAAYNAKAASEMRAEHPESAEAHLKAAGLAPKSVLPGQAKMFVPPPPPLRDFKKQPLTPSELSRWHDEPPERNGSPGTAINAKTGVEQHPEAVRYGTEAALKAFAKEQHAIVSAKPNGAKGTADSWRSTLDDGSKVLWKPKDGEWHPDYGHGGIRDKNPAEGTFYLREAAASAVAQNLGVSKYAAGTIIHEHVDHDADGNERHMIGALQSWIPGTRAYDTSDVITRASAEKMRVFDFVIGNTDRHAQNMLINDVGGKKVPGLIDHGLTFPQSRGGCRFIQPWDHIPHTTGPLLKGTMSQIAKIDVSKLATTLRKANIDRDAAKESVARALYLKSTPGILEVPKSRWRHGDSAWDGLQSRVPSEHHDAAEKVLGDIGWTS